MKLVVATLSAVLLLTTLAIATAERVPDDVSPKRRELLQAGNGLLAATNQTSNETGAPAPAPLGLGLGLGRGGQGGNGTRSGGNNSTLPTGEAAGPTGGSSGQTGITAGGNKSSPPKPSSPAGGNKTTPAPPTGGSGNGGTISTSGGGGSTVKNDHSVSYCNVYPADYTINQCGSTQPIPACCDDLYCYTNDDASGGNCKTTAPHPGCCEAVNQPTSVCALPTRGSCLDDYLPIPACCDTTSCEVYSDGSSVKCKSGFAAGCCPA